jgi:hypothetical protein
MESREYVMKNGSTCQHNAYTKKEIKNAWYADDSMQGHRQAVERGYWCVIVRCSMQAAIELSALFVREIFAIPECCNYDGKTLSMYCGDAGSGAGATKAKAEGLVIGYFRRVSEGGPLWAKK